MSFTLLKVKKRRTKEMVIAAGKVMRTGLSGDLFSSPSVMLAAKAFEALYTCHTSPHQQKRYKGWNETILPNENSLPTRWQASKQEPSFFFNSSRIYFSFSLPTGEYAYFSLVDMLLAAYSSSLPLLLISRSLVL